MSAAGYSDFVFIAKVDACRLYHFDYCLHLPPSIDLMIHHHCLSLALTFVVAYVKVYIAPHHIFH